MGKSSFKPILFLFLSFLLLCITTTAALGGTKVGGRKPIPDVESNKEVQDLGRYCVQEHNRQLKHQGNGSRLLVFSRVVAAETQVVSGIKYYLKIDASAGRGTTGSSTFEAVVVVKPWLKSKELIDFKPSMPHFTNTK